MLDLASKGDNVLIHHEGKTYTVDPRKTHWGNIMRKTNIDELPQFINVLLGDMSIVGPRPHMLLHTQEYSRSVSYTHLFCCILAPFLYALGN